MTGINILVASSQSVSTGPWSPSDSPHSLLRFRRLPWLFPRESQTRLNMSHLISYRLVCGIDSCCTMAGSGAPMMVQYMHDASSAGSTYEAARCTILLCLSSVHVACAANTLIAPPTCAEAF
eukprot:scaffold250658_cov42-Tisochrysis_lutea.AAC.3